MDFVVIKHLLPLHAKVCNIHPVPARAYSEVLALRRCNSLQTRDILKKSTEWLVSRWTRSCHPRVLCINPCLDALFGAGTEDTTNEDLRRLNSAVVPEFSTSAVHRLHLEFRDGVHDRLGRVRV
jgi:hypothetical protein